MLIYPNYSVDKSKQKQEVLKQIGENLCYYGSPTLDYQYVQDFDKRSTDYLQAKYLKISHVDSDIDSKCEVKASSHLKTVLNFNREFSIADKLVLATDQESTQFIVYQSNVMQGENIIEIIDF